MGSGWVGSHSLPQTLFRIVLKLIGCIPYWRWVFADADALVYQLMWMLPEHELTDRLITEITRQESPLLDVALASIRSDRD